MQENWKNWCRLCGSSGITIKLEGTSILQYHFKITENHIKICEKCNSYVSGFEEFLGRSENVQALFQELTKAKDSLNVQELNEFRSKFNLSHLDIATKTSGDFKQEAKNKDENQEFKVEKQEAEDIASVTSGHQELNFELLKEQFANSSDDEVKIKQEQPNIQYLPEVAIVEGTHKFQTKFSEQPQTSQESKRQSYYISKDLPIVCHICKESFRAMTALEMHTQNYHNCRPAIPCICGSSISNSYIYIRHKNKCFGNFETQYDKTGLDRSAKWRSANPETSKARGKMYSKNYRDRMRILLSDAEKEEIRQKNSERQRQRRARKKEERIKLIKEQSSQSSSGN